MWNMCNYIYIKHVPHKEIHTINISCISLCGTCVIIYILSILKEHIERVDKIRLNKEITKDLGK